MSETTDPARIVASKASSEQATATDDDWDDDCYLIGATEYSRIHYGDETRGGGNWHISSRTGQPQPCGDCAVPVDGYSAAPGQPYRYHIVVDGEADGRQVDQSEIASAQ